MGYTKHRRQIKHTKRTTQKQRIKSALLVDNPPKSQIEVSTGGNVINSGGYGCIFKPALKCKGNPRDKGKISKLMLTRHSEEEYTFIMKYKKKLEHIPDYADYFLLEGITICTPEKLTSADLTHYKKKCSALQKSELTSANLNDNLENVLAINMPDGGVDIGDFLAKHHSEGALIQLNTALIDLLNNGIVPMNKLHIYHCDIKETNILVQTKKKRMKDENVKAATEKSNKQDKIYTRLIDWGISVEWNNEKDLPEKLLNRPLQYNIPFSVILFNKVFLHMYKNMLKITPSPNYRDIKKVVVKFIMVWFKERGMGHFQTINQTLQLLMMNELDSEDEIKDGKEDKSDEDELLEELDHEENEMQQKQQHDYMFAYYYIADYLTTILSKYTMHGELNLLKYFDEVFIKNADLWGFIISYATILELYYNNYEKLNKQEVATFNKLKQIIVSFLFETVVTPIDVDQLTIELNSLTDLFRECRAVPSEFRKHQLLKRTSTANSIFDKITENDN
jgi:serine/threonine protein kinase